MNVLANRIRTATPPLRTIVLGVAYWLGSSLKPACGKADSHCHLHSLYNCIWGSLLARGVHM
jgi:hypothetical protein